MTEHVPYTYCDHEGCQRRTAWPGLAKWTIVGERDLCPEHSLNKPLIEEARKVIALGDDHEYLGGQRLAELVLEYFKEEL